MGRPSCNGRPLVKPLTEDGKRIRRLSRKWYGEYSDKDGITRCVPLATDRTALSSSWLSYIYADFHSLRSGATLKQAMQLARHSDPKLTMARYGRAQLHDLGETVYRLPSLLPTWRHRGNSSPSRHGNGRQAGRRKLAPSLRKL